MQLCLMLDSERSQMRIGYQIGAAEPSAGCHDEFVTRQRAKTPTDVRPGEPFRPA